MADQTSSFFDMFNKLAQDLKVPGVDLERLMEGHRKNMDAMVRAAQATSSGVGAVASKQAEIAQAAFTEVTALVHDFKPTGNPQEVIAKQTEFARKAFEAAMQHTRDIADLIQKSGAEATKIVQDRLRESLEEIRGTVDPKK
ncbi:phasin family protein [Reyranella sp. CPCC 100927]|uniref:phasin family protein n=1 Tax=Reyranella sp. CPCC 100927 TaxID=2599616 RepID=UPI0015B71701|nr:TIGR01841 family phasin [Reyranella sp. CPCC 100927]